MTFSEKILCLFESQWLNGVNDGLLRIYDWLRFVAVAGFVTVWITGDTLIKVWSCLPTLRSTAPKYTSSFRWTDENGVGRFLFHQNIVSRFIIFWHETFLLLQFVSKCFYAYCRECILGPWVVKSLPAGGSAEWIPYHLVRSKVSLAHPWNSPALWTSFL